jgi:hypothetical protein
MSFNFLNSGESSDGQRFKPIDTFIDPVSKIRVSNPGNLIDTDFEYGLQPTKWETVEIINNTPAFFSKSGDTTISDITGVTTNAGTREITVTTAFPHLLDVGIPIRVSGTRSLTADGSYIINATPTPTTFTYLSRANQEETVSIFDLYSSIITGEFFQGSQISISDSEGITTDGVGPNSTLTVKTSNKHGFGPNTPFYFLNLNSTVSQEFESQNTTSLSFDPTNSATAQEFDGSNTLLQTPIDLSNSATTSNFESFISGTNPENNTITVTLSGEDWSSLSVGDPLYHSITSGTGYFQSNPRGVVFLKSTEGIDQATSIASFQVSALPDGDAIDIVSNMTGYFQIADQARTFAGNNADPATQIDISVQSGDSFIFDGGNQGYNGTPENPPSNVATVVGYTGTTMTVFTEEGTLDYYEGAMLLYETDGDAATGLTNNTTYFVTSFAPGQSAGLFTMSIAALPGQSPINVSGGSGSQTFSKIGVSIDKDIVHVQGSSFTKGDMLEYTYPVGETDGNFGADFEQKFYFVQTAYDEHNYVLSEETAFSPMIATGGNIVSEIYTGGRVWKVHQFTSVGTSSFVVEDAGSEGEIEYLVIGGGGQGGNRGNGGTYAGGGGGAGGYKSSVQGESSGGNSPAEPRLSLSAGTYSVVVGAGGSGGGAGTNPGGPSSFDTIVALGGGGGAGSEGGAGSPGGSGGGGGGAANSTSSGGLGTTGQGSDGGVGSSNQSSSGGAGGGGGAGQIGGTGTTSVGGKGGDGLPSSITGSTVYRAGGGGGSRGAGNNGAGGLGGGGAAPGVGGQPNTGGGGGGIYSSGTNQPGGSGVVIVRYPITPEPTGEFIVATGGQVSLLTQDGVQYAVHEFTEPGTSEFEVLLAPSAPVQASPGPLTVSSPEANSKIEYLVIGGGGGSSTGNATNRWYKMGGGGAGGYRCSVPGESSGGGASAEEPLVAEVGTYEVIVGNGGNNTTGGVSQFGPIISQGGNSASGQGATSTSYTGNSTNARRPGIAGQGYEGGIGYNSADGNTGRNSAGGGGGAGGPGGDGRTGVNPPAGNGGIGVTSSINGTATTRAGGGGGSSYGTKGTGQAGGGNGAQPGSGTRGGTGQANTGSGGGGGNGSTGGSGIVIIRYPIGYVE